MAMSPMSMYRLDILPPSCAIEMQMTHNESGHLMLRFRASKTYFMIATRRSGWTGWFHWEGEPIELEWAVLRAL